MCWYGTILFHNVLQGKVIELDLYNSKFLNSQTNEVITATPSIILQFLLYKYFFIVSVILLMATMGILLTLFLTFHVYITCNGMTTNEFFKWRNVSSWHKKCCKCYDEARKNGDYDVSTCDEKNIAWNFSFGKLHYYSTNTTTTTTSVAKEKEQDDCTTSLQNDKSNGKNNNNNSSSTSTTAKTETNVKSVKLPAKDILYVEEENKIIILHPGKMPKNLYNYGVINNWYDVLCPRSLRNNDNDVLLLKQKNREVIKKELLVKKDE